MINCRSIPHSVGFALLLLLGTVPSVLAARSVPDEMLERSRAFQAEGRYREALAEADAVLELVAAESGGDQRVEAAALEAKGNALFYLNQEARAAAAFTGALALHRLRRDRFGTLVAMKDLGITMRVLGYLDQSMRLLETALDEIGPGDEDLEVSILGNLAAAYERLGANRLAGEIYERLLEKAERAGGVQGRIDALLRLGNHHAFSGDARQGQEALARALDLARAARRPAEIAWIEAVLGAALMEQRPGKVPDLAVSKQHLEASAAFYRSAGLTDPEAHRLLDLASVERLRGNSGRASALVSRALAVGERPGLRWRARAWLARVALEDGHADESLTQLSLADSEVSRRRAALHGAAERQELNREVRVLGELRARALLARGQDGDVGQALLALESQLLRNDEGVTLERDEATKRELSALHARLADPALPREDRNLLLWVLERLELDLPLIESTVGATDFFSTSEVDEGANSRELARSQAAISRVLDALAPGELLLRLHCADDRRIVIALGRGGANSDVAERPCDDLARRIQLLVQHIESDRREAAEATSVGLADLVFGSVGDRLGSYSRLRVLASGALTELPVEILSPRTRDRRADPRPLLETHMVVHDVSLSNLVERHEADHHPQAESESAKLLLLAGRSEDGEGPSVAMPWDDGVYLASFEDEGVALAHLPGTAREVDALSGFAAEGSVVRTGREASESWLKRQDLRRFDVLHFATHGLASVRRPERSALLLAPSPEPLEDGLLQAREISRLTLDRPLVVLSACQTGDSASGESRGLLGLAHAFQMAGADSVIASRWRIDDRSTADFMGEVYERLARGETVGSALLSTKRQWRGDPSRPMGVWAAFVLVGNGERVVPLAAASARRGPVWLQAQGSWPGAAVLALGLLSLWAGLRSRTAYRETA